jgi:hypothetical protein
LLAAAELACLRAEACAASLRTARARLRLLFKWLTGLVAATQAPAAPALSPFETATLMQVPAREA